MSRLFSSFLGGIFMAPIAPNKPLQFIPALDNPLGESILWQINIVSGCPCVSNRAITRGCDMSNESKPKGVLSFLLIEIVGKWYIFVLPAAALIVSAFQIAAEPALDRSKVLLNNLIFYAVYIQGCFSFVGLVFLGKRVAESAGFDRGDGNFQREVGFTHLGFAVAGLLATEVALFRTVQFWSALIIVLFVFKVGSAFNHIVQAVMKKNYSWSNVSMAFNVLVAALMLWLVSLMW
jgi:hypothetical protein